MMRSFWAYGRSELRGSSNFHFNRMVSIISWIKRNKLTSILIAVVLYLLLKPYFYRIIPYRCNYGGVGGGLSEMALQVGSSKTALREIAPLPLVPESPPTSQIDRLVVQESNLSLVVQNVRESVDKIIDHAKSADGYMVSSSLSQPEEAPYANVIVRVPAKNLKTVLEYFRSLSIKVSSENLYGYDVTDEYTDIEARLTTLNKTKAKFEEIMSKAEKIQDILEVQRQLISLQDQIDSLKGRQQYLEKTAELAKVTLYLSTDEFSLPYAPAAPFRPAVIFKQAVRSLVGTLRWLAKVAIWVGVYGAIIVPVALIVYFLRKRLRKAS